PLGAAGLEQVPVDGLHVPATWHWSDGAHVTGVPPPHAPAWHVSPRVHPLPSLHAVPLGALPSAGQTAEEPVQVSTASQAPVAVRQVTVEAANWQVPAVQQSPGPPLAPPWSHCSPSSTAPLPHTEAGQVTNEMSST